jgi:hypothetical protein
VIFLSKVEDAFQISERGCVIVPAIPRAKVEFLLHAQDLIQLRNPDGRILDTYIVGIEMVCGPKARDRMAFLLPADITKRDVPRGTEIWLTRDQ